MADERHIFRFQGVLNFSRNPVFSGNFPFGETTLGLHSKWNFESLAVNGKQPLCRFFFSIVVYTENTTV